MNDQFDELARNMAQSVTRRGALKKFGVGLASFALAALGLANKAEASNAKADPGKGGHGTRGCDHCNPATNFGCGSDLVCYERCYQKCIGPERKQIMKPKLDERATNFAQRVTLRAAGCALILIAILNGAAAPAQQFSAWSAPVNMGVSINTMWNDFHAAISSDGLTIFFSTDRPGGFGDYDLWVAERPRLNADWGPARNLGPKINTFTGEFTPELSPDGHWLFFSSSGFAMGQKFNVYAAYRSDASDNLGWGTPINLGKGVNANHPNGDPSLFINPQSGAVTLYFARFVRGQDDWDIYQSIQGADGAFGDAVPALDLNSRFRETHPTVRRDGLEVLFTSNRPGSLGDVDIWTSTRPTAADKWSAPVNLGPTINTEFGDRSPYLSDDGLTLILISDRPGGFGGNDLYISTRKRLQ